MDKEEWNGNVQINKNILTFTEKVFFGLTLKQAIYSGLTVVVTLLTYIIVSKFAPNSAMVVSAIVAIPVAAIGFVTPDGMSFFDFIRTLLVNFCMPNRIFYKTKSKYKEMIDNAKERKNK